MLRYTDLLNFIPFQNDAMNRCSISADSQIDNSVSDDSTDDETLDIKKNGYHDAENEVDQETDDDQDRVLSGKLSETSGYGGSDLYDYKVVSSSHLCIHLSNTLVDSHFNLWNATMNPKSRFKSTSGHTNTKAIEVNFTNVDSLINKPRMCSSFLLSIYMELKKAKMAKKKVRVVLVMMLVYIHLFSL